MVEGGSFTMGGPTKIDETQHQVTVSTFFMSKYEVTFDDYDLFSKATGYPMLKDGDFGRGKLPAINVSWEGAVFYCNWMSSRFNLDKVYDLRVDSSGVKITNVNWDANGFRLPTEAEWEYAARGGKLGGEEGEIEEYGWYEVNSEGRPHEVGTLKSNKLGIYDMRGNAFEWCWDIYDASYYSNSQKNDPYGPEKGDTRIYRGGCFSSTYNFVNVSKRFDLMTGAKDGVIGIRLVQSNQ